MSKEEKEQELVDEIQILTEQLKSFWGFLPIPVCSVNPAFTILETSGAFDAFFAVAKGESIGSNFGVLFVSPEKFKKWEDELISEGKIANQEVIFKVAETEKLALSFATARKDENNEVVGYFAAFIDISAIKLAEDELKQRLQELERFHRATVGRELKMVELKKEVARLKAELAKAESEKIV